MRPGRLLDISFAYVFVINHVRKLGYGVVKTLNYINEARNVDSANADLQSQSASSSSLELSPRKRKARGMFTDDDISTAVVVQEQPQKGTHDFSMSNNKLDATDTEGQGKNK